MADGPTFQSPYVQEAIPRLSAGVPKLIEPMHAGQSTPMTLPGQQLPQWDLGEQMKKGADVGKTLALLPAERQQAVAKATMDRIAAEHQKQAVEEYQNILKQINDPKTGLTPAQRIDYLLRARAALMPGWNGGAVSDPNAYLREYYQLYGTSPPVNSGLVPETTQPKKVTPPNKNTPETPETPEKPKPKQEIKSPLAGPDVTQDDNYNVASASLAPASFLGSNQPGSSFNSLGIQPVNFLSSNPLYSNYPMGPAPIDQNQLTQYG